MKNKKGFTLIELLAVIIILGILMIIAIPSVTSYISNSRKSAYINTAKELIVGARNIVNEGNLGMYSTDTTYYIPSSYIKTENASKSPYGEFVYAYIGIIYDGKGYKYYWISVDETGQGVDEITPYDQLDEDDIKSDIDSLTIKEKVDHIGIGNRKNILILDSNGKWGNQLQATDFVSDIDGGSLIYQEGKNANSIAIGDLVRIGTEEFYVLGIDGNKLNLLARYNLKVGKNAYHPNGHVFSTYSSSDPGYGIQFSGANGYAEEDEISYGTLAFYEGGNVSYWKNKIGSTYPGSYSSLDTRPYVYDSNSLLYQYVEAYKDYLSKYDVDIVEARLPNKTETTYISDHPIEKWHGTSYWSGVAYDDEHLTVVMADISFAIVNYRMSLFAGIRPVIVIKYK